MKNLIAIGLLCLWSAVRTFAQLPEESGELMKKLGEFEAEERANLEALVKEKKGVVITVLDSHLKEETKKGRLETALAINRAVEALRKGDPVRDPEGLPDASADLLQKLAEFESMNKAKTEELIAEKKALVVGLLKKRLESETKQGRFEPALAVNEAIKTLEAEIAAVSGGYDAGTMLPGAPAPKIPGDAVRHDRAHFKAYLTEKTITWEEAAEKCEEHGGRLAWFDSPDDEKMIQGILKDVVEKTGHSPVWVGGSMDRDGNWIWTNGEPVDPGFWAKESDSAARDPSHVMVRWIGSFQPERPDSPRVVGYICRWK